MKLDKIKFVMLCVKLQSWFDDGKRLLSQYDIEELEHFFDIEVSALKVPASDVDELLRQIAAPDGFISAIKAYRALTGEGLKESKQAIERYRIVTHTTTAIVENKPASEPATLGDILGHATGRTKAGNDISGI